MQIARLHARSPPHPVKVEFQGLTANQCLPDSDLMGLLATNSVPEAAACRRFHGSSFVSRVHRPDPVLGVLCKKVVSDQYAIHDNFMI